MHPYIQMDDRRTDDNRAIDAYSIAGARQKPQNQKLNKTHGGVFCNYIVFSVCCENLSPCVLCTVLI